MQVQVCKCGIRRPLGRAKGRTILMQIKTCNLSKAHVTRDSSGPAIWAIMYNVQSNNNAS